MGGYWGEERLRNLYYFLKRPVPIYSWIYQLLIYSLIGQFLMCVSEIEKSPVNVKVEPRSTFVFTRGLSYIASISFTHVNVTRLPHVKITRQWISTLRQPTQITRVILMNIHYNIFYY